MKIKSNTHAMELLKDLEKQGFIRSWWKVIDGTEGKRSFQKNWFFTNKQKGDSVNLKT